MENDRKPLILVAEDDIFISDAQRNKLAKEGFDVCIAGNGIEVLAKAREKAPDIILLDLIMPLKDGFETLKELKADAKLKNIKVIVLSNLSEAEDKKKVMDMGAIDYVVKANSSLREIVELIKRNLKVA